MAYFNLTVYLFIIINHNSQLIELVRINRAIVVISREGQGQAGLVRFCSLSKNSFITAV